MRRTLAALAALALRPENALACAVCFGQDVENKGLASGLSWGLVLLLGSTFAILGVLTAAVMRIERGRPSHGDSHEPIPSRR